jgi:hypothetical protein
VEVAEIDENVEEPVVTSVQQGSKQIQTSHFWNGRCPPPWAINIITINFNCEQSARDSERFNVLQVTSSEFKFNLY